ncbi:MAG: hypothetical protein H8E16_19910 [Flavobacteriales bacterium]|nr:hypothetical protein [Flavobacteriales bacterium]
MEVIWVLENVKRDKFFYGKLQLTLLVASISLWRKYHPDHYTVFYCDNLTYDTLNKLQILHLWHDVRKLEYPDDINREIFWSGCKTKIISETTKPILVIDHDFLIRKNIDKYLNTNVLYSYDEIANNWYPPKWDAYAKMVPFERIVDRAANVSLFYLPDPKFSNKYGKQVLENHKVLSKIIKKLPKNKKHEISANYMILSEQLMLKQWLVKDKIPHETLSNLVWDCNKPIGQSLSENIKADQGIWNSKECSLYYKHYGVEEKHLKENYYTDTEQEYQKNINYLRRCIIAGKLVDYDTFYNGLRRDIYEI